MNIIRIHKLFLKYDFFSKAILCNHQDIQKVLVEDISTSLAL